MKYTEHTHTFKHSAISSRFVEFAEKLEKLIKALEHFSIMQFGISSPLLELTVDKNLYMCLEHLINQSSVNRRYQSAPEFSSDLLRRTYPDIILRTYHGDITIKRENNDRPITNNETVTVLLDKVLKLQGEK